MVVGHFSYITQLGATLSLMMFNEYSSWHLYALADSIIVTLRKGGFKSDEAQCTDTKLLFTTSAYTLVGLAAVACGECYHVPMGYFVS